MSLVIDFIEHDVLADCVVVYFSGKRVVAKLFIDILFGGGRCQYQIKKLSIVSGTTTTDVSPSDLKVVKDECGALTGTYKTQLDKISKFIFCETFANLIKKYIN